MRTWHVLAPIALERGDTGLLRRIRDWYERMAPSLPDTPYARVTRAGIDATLARVDLLEPAAPRVEHLRTGLAEPQVLPSYFSAVEAIVGTWLDTGDIDAARRGLDAVDEALRSHPSEFGKALVQLLRSRIDRDPDLAAEAAAAFDAVGAAPWAAQARSAGR